MNKKSVNLILSLLFLVGVVFYVWATGLVDFAVTHIAEGDSATTYGITNWTKGGLNDTINFTITIPSNASAENVSFVTIEFDEATAGGIHNWENGTAAHDIATVISGTTILETWVCNATETDLVTMAQNDTQHLNWTCHNQTADTQLKAGTQLNVAINVSVNSVSDEREGYLNYTIVYREANNSDAFTHEYDNVFGLDDQSPRLIEVNISDGNTTFHNSTWGTHYFIRKDGPLTINALIEDTWLNATVVLAYNCNSSNITDLGSGLTTSGYAVQEVLTATDTADGAVGTLDHKALVTISTVDCSSWQIANGNESLTFSFLANDSFNHHIQLNGTSDKEDRVGGFNIWFDDAELLPSIVKVNVSQTSVTTSDGVIGISRTLDSSTSGELNGAGTDDYLKGSNLTFGIELSGGYKPHTVQIWWNETGADTTNLVPVLGDTWVVEKLHTGMILNATNLTTGAGDGLGDQALLNSTTTLYGGVGVVLTSSNDTDQFVFWVVANNTGNNYTRLSGPHRFRVDGIGPTMTMTAPADRTITPRGSITYSCKAEDDLSGAYKIRWDLVKPQTQGTKSTTFESISEGVQSITFSNEDTMYAGTYEVKCIGLDQVGNEKIYTSTSGETFSVHHSTGGVSGEGPSAAADIDLATQEEVTIKEKQGTISTFTLDGTTIHKITIKEVDEILGTVTIIIESDPIEITLKIGETKEVDVDVDGENDISVTLNSITEGVVDLTTKRLTPLPTEEVPTEEVPPEEAPTEMPPEEAPSKAWLWILIIVIIVVIGVGYWFMKKKK